MEFLGKEDEQLIQNMIDGNLSGDEIDKFEKLIASSMAARKMYADLMRINTALVTDAQNVKRISFSEKIMQKLSVKNSFAKKTIQKKPFLSNSFNSKSLAYAAILIAGLIFGSVVTYLGTHSGSTPDNTLISGTIAPLTDNKSYFNNKTTKINVQESLFGSLKLHTVTLETTENLHCQIVFSDEKGRNENAVKLLYTNGIFKKESANGKLVSYVCNGISVFQIAQDVPNSGSENLTIQFIRKGKIINEFSLN